MDNFHENNEFPPRRKINPAEQNRGIQPPGTVRRPQNSPQRPSSGRIPQNQQPTGQIKRPADLRTANNTIRSESQNTLRKDNKQQQSSVDIRALIRNFFIFIGMLTALLILGFSLLLSSLHAAPEKEKTSYDYYYGASDKSTSPSVTVNRILYINLSEISELCAFTVSGTKACLRYTADQNEYIEFTIGSVSAKINGDIVNMEGAALIRENENVWIPFSFVESYFEHIGFEKDDEEKTIRFVREKIPESPNNAPEYLGVTFKIKGSQTIKSIDEDPYIGNIADMGFINDLSEYEKYMNPSDKDAYLILVNKTNTISPDDIPESLVSIVNVKQDDRKEQMVECAAKALEALFIEMKSAGYKDVFVTSGYRSYTKQVSLFSTYLQREMANNPSLSEAEAKEIVLTYSAFPGTSEHQTGLCCDMHNLRSADIAFAQKAAYTWLKDNCYKFGFIIRFPEDKVDITGYSFEPWHYRFVGRYHATRMHNLGMCLEEYIEHLAKAENQ